MKVEYLCDDRGFRFAKLNFANYRTTWYIRDASGNVISTYEETGVSAATRDEGGIHPPQPPAWVIQTEIPVYGSGKLGLYYPQQDASMTYEITDHLGNVRALLRDNISVYTATMEDNGQQGETNPRNEEMAYFQNIEETVVTDARMNHTEATPYGTPDKAAYLFWNDTQGTLAEEKAIGPAIALRVQAGDSLKLETWSRFERKNDYTHDFGLVALSALLGNTFSASGGFEGFTINNTISNLEGALTAGAFPDDGGDDTRPFAYLNYIVYDENMVYQSAGWRRVTDEAGFYPEEIGLPEKKPVRVAFEQPITINESGYIYVWVSNQSKETRVWFDDLQVTHTQNIVVQATDYGVWGDVLREQKTDESIYRFGYQGQFAEKDEETGWNHFELREYDPVIGRWTVVDPMRQHYSPYLSMSNSPINSIDPSGGVDWYQNNETKDLEWINGSAEIEGYTYLGEDLIFEFSSFIDRASFDGMYGLKDFLDFSGEKMYSWVNLDFSQDADGNLVGSPTVTMGSEVMKTFGLIKGSSYPGMPNIATSTVNGQNFSVNFERHTMVNWFLEAPVFPIMGYNVVNVAQRLEISGQGSVISYKAFTDIFPSASLSINGTRVMRYFQPSFQKTHGLFSRPSPSLYQRTRNSDY